jgi:c-di-GMP-binding flagellar brake protein YcgR
MFLQDRLQGRLLRHNKTTKYRDKSGSRRIKAAVKNVISMDQHLNKTGSQSLLVRDRRYAIRHPFAADVEFFDLEAGSSGSGVTSDLSLGGCFVCTSKPLALNSRVKLKLTRKDLVIEALAVVRIVKPRIGMGIEFLDVDEKHHGILERWLLELKRER